jgi:hypothetical protein
MSIMVNKLGDTTKKVQCHTIYLLVKVLLTNKDFGELLIREV